MKSCTTHHSPLQPAACPQNDACKFSSQKIQTIQNPTINLQEEQKIDVFHLTESDHSIWPSANLENLFRSWKFERKHSPLLLRGVEDKKAPLWRLIYISVPQASKSKTVMFWVERMFSLTIRGTLANHGCLWAHVIWQEQRSRKIQWLPSCFSRASSFVELPSEQETAMSEFVKITTKVVKMLHALVDS